MPDIGYAFDRQQMVRVTRDLQYVESLAQSREGAYYGAPPSLGKGSSDGFYVRIASSEAVTDQPNHYVYTGYRQIPYTPGLWQDDPDNPDPITPIYNSMEANNSDTGVQGNGTDLADYPDGTTIPPLRGNPVLWCTPGVDCYGDPEYWVSAPNAAPVTCGGA
jgi:hypothetical protein